jgi:hypothetical protein
VVFEGVRGSGIKGDIAIDDITVTPGSCTSAGNVYLYLLEKIHCFCPVCLSVTKDCMFYFYIYISNKNSLKLCILAVNHIKIQILLWQIHSTIFAAVLSSFMTYHLVCNYINTTGATSGAGTAYPCGTHKFTPGF